MLIIIDWSALVTSCIMASIVGIVTGLTNWLLTRRFIQHLEHLEESLRKKRSKEKNGNA